MCVTTLKRARMGVSEDLYASVCCFCARLVCVYCLLVEDGGAVCSIRGVHHVCVCVYGET